MSLGVSLGVGLVRWALSLMTSMDGTPAATLVGTVEWIAIAISLDSHAQGPHILSSLTPWQPAGQLTPKDSGVGGAVPVDTRQTEG